MKKPAFLLAFFFPLFLTAQVEFAPLGATWYYDLDPWLPWWKIVYVKVEVTGIDTIQGRVCKRIESKDHLGNSHWGCSFYYPVLHTFEKDGRVYSFHDDDFYLLYDFNANVGESWTIHNPPLSIGDSLVVRVDSISWMELNGNTLRVQHVSTPGYEPWELLEWGPTIVEGIGNTGFITPQFPTCDPWIYGLRCYQDDTHDLHFVDYPCDTVAMYSGTQSPILRGGLLSPNPVSGNTLMLSESIDADRVVLQNTLGAMQKSLEIQAGNRVDLEEIPPGVYFVQVFKTAHLIGVDKLVVLKR